MGRPESGQLLQAFPGRLFDPQVPSDSPVEWGATPPGSLYKVHHSLSAYRQPSHVLVCRIEAIVNNHADEALA
jgi:hypothetical protein